MNVDWAEAVKEWDEAELTARFAEARDELEQATNSERNSEWHDCCFAAVLLLGNEMLRRGIDQRTLH